MQPTEHRVTEGSDQGSLAVQAGAFSYEETSKMLQQTFFDRQ